MKSETGITYDEGSRERNYEFAGGIAGFVGVIIGTFAVPLLFFLLLKIVH